MKTTTQDLFDRWISEAYATKMSVPARETNTAFALRQQKIKILLDCAAQLHCIEALPGSDPRDQLGFDSHVKRIADRAAARVN